MLTRRQRAAALIALAISTSVATGAERVTVSPAFGAQTAPPPASPEPLGWILVDAGTGRVLDGREIHTARPTASMVKIFTALTALERLEPTATIPVTQIAVDHAGQNRNPSGMALGQTWPLNDILGTLLVISANDAAYSLADATSGSLVKFAEAQRETAKRIGLRDSTLNDPSGLDDRTAFQGGPKMSPFDVAITTRAALGVPALAKFAKMPSYSYIDPKGVQHVVENHNQLLSGLKFAYQGATGFKTGHTKLAGNTLTASATRGGRTLIAVVMNTDDTFGWTTKILNDGFATPVGAQGLTETLPRNSYATLPQRRALQQDFVSLATSSPAAHTSTPASNAPKGPATSIQTTTPRQTPTTKPAAKAASGTSGTSGTTYFIGFLFVAAIGLVGRREQIKRRKSKRRARQRATQAALRRGSLPVVDGRYRAGMRTGPPVQSNVKLRRNDE